MKTYKFNKEQQALYNELVVLLNKSKLLNVSEEKIKENADKIVKKYPQGKIHKFSWGISYNNAIVTNDNASFDIESRRIAFYFMGYSRKPIRYCILEDMISIWFPDDIALFNKHIKIMSVAATIILGGAYACCTLIK